jgi:thiamine monophosphate synthase
VAAIGGIGIEDLSDLMESGAQMAAVISAIASAADPRVSARALVQGWEALKHPELLAAR